MDKSTAAELEIWLPEYHLIAAVVEADSSLPRPRLLSSGEEMRSPIRFPPLQLIPVRMEEHPRRSERAPLVAEADSSAPMPTDLSSLLSYVVRSIRSHFLPLMEEHSRRSERAPLVAEADSIAPMPTVRSSFLSRFLRRLRANKDLDDFKQTADGQLVVDCLQQYNSTHLDDQYEPVPGKVTQHHLTHEGIRWTYGSFVASRKFFFGGSSSKQDRFFFEFASTDRFCEVVTCAPLLGEAYCTTVDIIATSEARADKEARRRRATKGPSGDGLEEGTKRAEPELMLTRPAAPPCPSTIFARPDPGSIPIGGPLDSLQLHRLEEERRRAMDPGHFKQLTMDGRLVMDCLRHYNSMHLGDEYEAAPGKVTRHCHLDNGICWTHGNFVARRKRSGWFSFLPAPRTLFFFELAFKDGSDQVVTCTPLLDEPVTEAYSVLGCPLWWSTWRSGRLDCICKTCNRRLDVLHPDLKRTFACGHKEVDRVCKMCYHRSNVLHPPAGEFAFGHSRVI